MKSLLWITGLTLLISLGCKGPVESNKDIWTSMFNGIDLTGWTPKFSGYPAGENYQNTFQVSDSILHVSYTAYDSFRNEFGHLYSDRSFRHFRLRLDYRFVGDPTPGAAAWAVRNNGVMILSQSAQSMGIDQDFPVSVEFQFLGGTGTDKRPTAGVCTPGTHVYMGDTLTTQHCIMSSAETYQGDQWVSIEVAVMPDGNIYHLVEGDTVARYARPEIGGGYLPDGYPLKEGERVTEGYIALQAESHATDFRNIRIQEIR